MHARPRNSSTGPCGRTAPISSRRGRGSLLLRSAASCLAPLVAFAGGALAGQDDGPPPGATTTVPAALRRLAFVENLGQWDTPAIYVAALADTVVQVETDAFVVQSRVEGSEEGVTLRFALEGAREEQRPRGQAQLPGLRNYFLGSDPERWRSGARGFAEVVYPGLREGVELRLRDGGGWLEYDLHLEPGADPSSVVLRCEGVTCLEVDAEGGLRMQTAAGVLRQSPPVTWCVLPSGETESVECAFVVLDATRFGFRLAEHDPDLPVVIDPGLEWATYLGGSGEDVIAAAARRASGEIVVAGWTASSDFPTPSGLYPSPLGGYDGFVSVLDSTGSSLAWSTYYGGSGLESVTDVDVNAAGEVFVTGPTSSTDFPVTPATAWQSSYLGGARDGFVAQFAADGSQLLYGSYLGSADTEYPTDIEVSEPRVLSLAGTLSSTSFPTTPDAFQPAPGGGLDYFLCRLDLDQAPAAQLVYSTYLGGSGDEGFAIVTNPIDVQTFDLHLDAQGVMTVAGRTFSADFPVTPNAFQPIKKGPTDGCITRIDPSHPGYAGLVYSTFLGEDNLDGAQAVSVDSTGVLTVGGSTYSPRFPTTPGAYQPALAGVADGFLVRLDTDLTGSSQLLYGTFLGGSSHDNVRSIDVDPSGGIVATLETTSDDVPTTAGAWSRAPMGFADIVVLHLAPRGQGESDLLYSTYIGGSMNDDLLGGMEILSWTPTLKVVVAGCSYSDDFPHTPGAYQPGNAGGWDGVVLQLEINPHTYCEAAANSAGPDGALICGTGSVGIADNTFTLEVSGATPNDFGLFYYGNAAVQMPLYNGTRCVGGTGVFRLLPVVKIDASGHASRLLDFTQPPAGSGPGTILPGSTWYFQFWYRDPNGGGTGANLSNGLKATFYP